MGKGKQVIVSWDDVDDDGLFDDDLIEPSQGQYATATDDATPAAAAAAAAAPARIFRSTEPAVMTPMNELYLGTLDLRNEINQLSTSNSNVNIHGRLEPISGTNPGVDHHTDGGWKSERGWRNDRKGASKPTLPAKEDLRDSIKIMTRQMKDLESPGTHTTGSGITLVAIRDSSDPKSTSSSGRPSASDVIAAPLKRDSYRPRSRSRSRSRGGESSRRRKSRSQSRERSSWSRSRRRSWSWTRGRARSRSRDRSRERDTTSRHRSRSRGRGRSRDRRRNSRERSRSRDRRRSSRERSRSRDGHRSRGRSRGRDWGRDRDNDKDREKDKERDRGRRRSRSRSTTIGKNKSRGRSRSGSIPRIKEEDKPRHLANSVLRDTNSLTSSASPSVHGTAQTSFITTTDTIPASSPSLSTSLSTLRSPADYPATLSSSSMPSMVNNPTTLSQTTTLSNTEALIGSMDLTRTTTLNTTTTSSAASSPVTDPLLITDPSLVSELEDPITATKIKLEPEDAPSLSQVAKASSPEMVVKQEPLSSDDATKILREASQPALAITKTTTTTSEPGLPDPIEAEVGAQDAHYFVIRVSDEVDFNDARKNNVWPTNPMYDKALRGLYNPTSQVFLIFTVFMSSEFCGIAKMASEIMWVGERTIFDKSTLRQKFKLQWVACSRVSYDSVKVLTHEPVYKIIRKNGHELTQDMGGAIHKLLVENQTKEEPQRVLASQEADNSVLDISTTSFSQEVLMGKVIDGQESSTPLLDSMFRDTSDMDIDVSELTAIDSNDNHKDDDEYEVDYGDDSSSMDLDSNLDADVALIELASPKLTPRHSPRARKRSVSADENVDLSVELELAHEEREQLARGRSLEPPFIERVDRKTDDKEDQVEEEREEEQEEEDEEMEKGADFIRQDASPIRARWHRKHDSSLPLTPPPPLHPSLPSRRWSPSRRRSPPPPRPRSSPPPRKRSPPPPSRNRSPPPPRRNRSPPPPRRRSPPPLRRRSPPPLYYHQPPSYGRPGFAAACTPYYGFRSPPPFPQRSKDPRDRSASTYVFHSGNEPNYQHDRFHNAPTDPRLSGSRSASSSVVPQKRPYDETSRSLEDDKSGILGEGEFDDLPASVFPLADDDDDGMSGHFAPPPQAGNPSAAAGSSSSSAAPGGLSSSTSTVPPADPPPQITSITLVPAGLSKSRRKKMRKEAFSKPLDF